MTQLRLMEPNNVIETCCGACVHWAGRCLHHGAMNKIAWDIACEYFVQRV